MKFHSNFSPYVAGIEAALAGEDESKNPYPENSIDYWSWLDGWSNNNNNNDQNYEDDDYPNDEDIDGEDEHVWVNE